MGEAKTSAHAPPWPGQPCPLIHMCSHLWPRPPAPAPAGRQILKSVHRRGPEGPSKKFPPEEQPWGSWAPAHSPWQGSYCCSWKPELPEAVRTPRRPWGWGGVGRGYLAPLLRTRGPETPYWLQSLLIHRNNSLQQSPQPMQRPDPQVGCLFCAEFSSGSLSGIPFPAGMCEKSNCDVQQQR